jgi:hypothetical protein
MTWEPGGRGQTPAAVRFLLQKINIRPVAGAVGMWESRSDFQGAVGRVENLVLVFQAFHGAVISTALCFWRFVLLFVVHPFSLWLSAC